MRGALACLGLLALTARVTPAIASSAEHERFLERRRQQELQRPSPCDHVIPSGALLPRTAIADVALGGTLMIGTPTPTWRDRPIGIVGKNEPMTVLQECGDILRIRNVRGLEGWVHVVLSKSELTMWEQAKNRPAETDRDCEILNLDSVVIDRCKAGLAAVKAHQDEIDHGSYMSGDELKAFVVGRTVRLVERHPGPGIPPAPLFSYGRPDGEYFLLQGRVSDSGMRWRGHYRVDGDRVCYPGEGTWCGRMRKVGGDLIWSTPNGKEYLATSSEGDPIGIVAEVSIRYPTPIAPPVPKGAEDIAGPVASP